jgi:uncharacterized protein YrrD
MLENIALFLSQVSHGSISSRVHKVSDFIFDPESDHLGGGLLKVSLRFFRKHLNYDLKTDFCLVSHCIFSYNWHQSLTLLVLSLVIFPRI